MSSDSCVHASCFKCSFAFEALIQNVLGRGVNFHTQKLRIRKLTLQRRFSEDKVHCFLQSEMHLKS